MNEEERKQKKGKMRLKVEGEECKSRMRDMGT